MTRLLNPNIPVGDIMRVNARLDNATMMDKTMNALFGRETSDFFGLTKHGHRAYNHNLASALMVANIVSQKYGSRIAVSHLMQDTLSNMLVDKYGVEGRDLFEAVFNYSIANKVKKRRSKKMFRPF